MSTLTINLNNVQPLDTLLTDISALSYSGNANKYLRVNAGGTAFEFATVAGGGTWGSITGTLSDQTDLQNALDAKLSIASAASTYLTIANAASTYLALSGGTLIGDLLLATLKASGSGGLTIKSNNNTDIGLLGAGNTANVTWYGSHNFDTATQDTIAAFTGAGKTLSSLALATYPSLTELSYVKGVTSSIQTQINAKLSTATAASTYVPYTGATGAVNLGANNLTVDTNVLFVDATNNRVGIGTATPSEALHVMGVIRCSSYLQITSGIYQPSCFNITSNADGKIRLSNNAGTGFEMLQFATTTSSSPALKRIGTELQVRLADDSGYAPLQASQFFSNDGYLGYGKIVVSNGTSGSPTVLTSSDSGKHYVNTGASAETYINLPTAVEGLRFRFTTNTNQRIRVVAATGDIIRYSDSSASTSGGYAQSINAAAGISIEIEAVDSTYWQVVGVTLSGGTPFYTFA